VFLLVPAHPGSPGQRAVKRLLLLLLLYLECHVIELVRKRQIVNNCTCRANHKMALGSFVNHCKRCSVIAWSVLLVQISIPMSLEFDDLSLVRENPTEEMQSKDSQV